MKIKPIQTNYDGYCFRSRLEARWAVFFNTLEMEYRYESEGFDVNGVWYLPDFYLPGQKRCWLEIKPDLGSLSNRPSNPVFDSKFDSKEDQSFVMSFAVSIGEPWVEPKPRVWTCRTRIPSYKTFTVDPYSEVFYSVHVLSDFPYLWCECPICQKVGLEFEGRAGRLCDCLENADKLTNNATPRLLAAFKAAREARFEYQTVQFRDVEAASLEKGF